jgi:hypothetical protein
MFGLGFKGKIKQVLSNDFRYEPNAMMGPVLSEIASQAKAHGANEYDAAIMFMLSQMNALMGDGDNVKIFIDNHSQNIVRLISLTSSPYEEIIEMLDQVRVGHGLEALSNSSKKDDYLGGPDYSSFQEWYQDFQTSCGEHDAGLKPNEDGASLIDFMDHEPLERAYRDGICPDKLATKFASDFDIRTFGQLGQAEKPREKDKKKRAKQPQPVADIVAEVEGQGFSVETEKSFSGKKYYIVIRGDGQRTARMTVEELRRFDHKAAIFTEKRSIQSAVQNNTTPVPQKSREEKRAAAQAWIKKRKEEEAGGGVTVLICITIFVIAIASLF